jgi:hypothetical protein
MKLLELACLVFDRAEALKVPHMVVGAIAAGAYGIARATKDVDLLVSMDPSCGVFHLMSGLDDLVEFEPQAQFDTITWGRRWIGLSKCVPPFTVELFEMMDDPFCGSEFARRVKKFVPLLQRHLWLPTAEDVIVQKIRWGRDKDLIDARDVLAVQGPETLEMDYIRNWCSLHGTTQRLETILASLPPMD